MKRIFAMVLACMLLLGCSSLSALADDVVTLRVWAGIQPEYGYDTLIENFNAAFKDKGIQAEYTRYVNNADGNLQVNTFLMGGGEIDVLIGYGTDRLKTRVEGGYLVDLTDMMAAAGFDPVAELGEANTVPYTIDGKYYGLNTKYENSNYLFVNVDMFKAAGIEIPYDGWTYSEFREVAKKLTQGEGFDKIYGMYWNYNSGPNYSRGFCRNILDEYAMYKNLECTESNFNDPLTIKGVQLMVDTMRTDMSAPSVEDEKADSMSIQTMFLGGKCAMALGISQLRLVKDLATYPHDFTTAIVPMPVPDETFEDKTWSFLAGAGDIISIASSCEHKDAAFEFLLWYVKGGMNPLARGGRIPLWKGTDANEVAAALMDGAEGVFELTSLQNYINIDKTNTTMLLDHPEWALAEITAIYNEEFENALYGMKTVEAAMNDATTRSNDAISLAIKNAAN